MIVRMLSNTPPWVFLLFFVLLAVGAMQARTRSVRRTPALLLPAGMVALSLVGIQSSFGFRTLPLVCWGVALVVATVAGYVLGRDGRVTYDVYARRFFVPGSWGPLAVIMAVFFSKYVYAVMLAFGAEVIAAPWFVAGLSGWYGLLSGYFAARALRLLAAAHTVQASVRERPVCPPTVAPARRVPACADASSRPT